MTDSEKKGLVVSIFSNQDVFEKHILNISSSSDRVDVISILSKRIVRVLLREEFNFLYMKDLSNFKFSLIVNRIFHEIANEWLSYAQEVLIYDQSDALDIIQEKENLSFVFSIAKEYFHQYKSFFTKEIANSFIELIEIMPFPSASNTLIDEVINSPFVKNQNISVVYSYSQLWNRVKSAHDFKQEKIGKLQIQIDETNNKVLIRKYEYEEELLEQKSLAYFDEALLRLCNTMVAYMQTIKRY